VNLLYGTIAVLLGLFILGTALRLACLRRRVLGWPTVRGRITMRSVIEPTNRGVLTSPVKRWIADVRYTYAVNGTQYQGDKTELPWAQLSSKEAAEAILAAIPDVPQVRYDPASPATSCLFPPETRVAWVFALASGVPLLMAVIWLLPQWI
jgi:hypothetical protein